VSGAPRERENVPSRLDDEVRDIPLPNSPNPVIPSNLESADPLLDIDGVPPFSFSIVLESYEPRLENVGVDPFLNTPNRNVENRLLRGPPGNELLLGRESTEYSSAKNSEMEMGALRIWLGLTKGSTTPDVWGTASCEARRPLPVCSRMNSRRWASRASERG
jgi:hypothetical protein